MDQKQKDKIYSQRYRDNNKESINARSRERYKESPRQYPRTLEQERRWKLKSYYGITIEEYDQLVAQQNGGCAICGGPPIGRGAINGFLSVDHDHETKEIRGLLCSQCNTALGMFKDDPLLLMRATQYLAGHLIYGNEDLQEV